ARAQNEKATQTSKPRAETVTLTTSEKTKADLVKPVQVISTIPTGSCTVNAMVLDSAAAAGQQLYICKDMGNNTTQWVMANDESTLTASVTAETNRATSAETTLQNNINAEATTRAAGDATLTANLNTEISNRTAAVTAEATTRE